MRWLMQTERNKYKEYYAASVIFNVHLLKKCYSNYFENEEFKEYDDFKEDEFWVYTSDSNESSLTRSNSL